MKITDYRPTNPFSWIIFVVACVLVAAALGIGITAAVRGRWGWYAVAAACELGALLAFHIVRGMEAQRVRDEEAAAEAARRDAEIFARPYEPEGDP